MAWTDILQGARQGLNASLDRQQAKRSGALDRLSNTFGRIGAQRHDTAEREAGQLFAQDEAIKQREFEAGLAGMEIKANVDLEELRRVNNVALEDLRNTHQEALIGLEDAKAIERERTRYANDLDVLQKDIDARILAAETAAAQPRQHYETQSQSFGGREYTWTSDQEFDLVQLKMQRDMLIDQIALEKEGLSDSYWGTAAQVVKDRLLLPSVYNEATGQWNGANPKTREQWEIEFRNAMLGEGDWDQDEIDQAARYFMLFIDTATEEDPGEEPVDEPGGARDLSFGITEESPFGRLLAGREERATTHATGQYGFTIPEEHQAQPGEAPDMGTGGYGAPSTSVEVPSPEGWDSTEMAMWGQFQRLFNSVPQEKLPAVYEAMDIVANQDVDPVDIQDLIDALLAPSGPRTFNYTPREELN